MVFSARWKCRVRTKKLIGVLNVVSALNEKPFKALKGFKSEQVSLLQNLSTLNGSSWSWAVNVIFRLSHLVSLFSFQMATEHM